MEFITEKERIYAENTEGKIIAEITFPLCGSVYNIDHTFVDESLRGQGVAGKLVRLAADEISRRGAKLAATCPYAVAWFARHPEYALEDSGNAPCCPLR